MVYQKLWTPRMKTKFEFPLFSFTIRNTNMAADVTVGGGGGI